MYKEELSHFSKRKFPIVLSVLLISVLQTVLRGTEQTESPIGLRKCEGYNWMILGIAFVLLIAC